MEEWRAVAGYDGWYEVSSLGHVRRIRGGMGARPGCVLTPTPTKGYPCVKLSRDGRSKTWAVHILVARAFLPPPLRCGLVVNHKDTNKANSAASNLEWVTQLRNVQHAHEHGLIPMFDRTAEANGNARLTWEQVRQIRADRARLTQKQQATAYRVSPSTIQAILAGRLWPEE